MRGYRVGAHTNNILINNDKIRILFIDGTHEFGGAIISLSYMVHGLRKTNMEIELVSAQPIDRKIKLFPNIKTFNLRTLLTYNHRYKFQQWLKRIKSNRTRKIICRIYTIADLLIGLIYFVRLLILIRNRKPDIVHINNSIDQWEAILASKLTGVSCIVHQRAFVSYSKTLMICTKFIDKIITISNSIKDQLISIGIDENKIHTVYNTIDIPIQDIQDNTNPLKEVGAEREHLCAIFGRITPWKGQHIFINAIAEVKKKIPGIRALIVGNSPDGAEQYLDYLYELVDKLSLNDNIIFTGYREDVCNIYSTVDLVVHASIEPEPFGRTIIEAMAYAKPVIATAIGGPLEIIANNIDGFLIEPGDPIVLSSLIYELLIDPQRRKLVGKKARKKIIEKFSVDAQVEQIQSIYKNVHRRSL